MTPRLRDAVTAQAEVEVEHEELRWEIPFALINTTPKKSVNVSCEFLYCLLCLAYKISLIVGSLYIESKV